jgi:hypothetical protein
MDVLKTGHRPPQVYDDVLPSAVANPFSDAAYVYVYESCLEQVRAAGWRRVCSAAAVVVSGLIMHCHQTFGIMIT